MFILFAVVSKDPVILTSPITSSFADGVAVPIPTFEPEITKSFWLKVPMITLLSENTSTTGNPAMVFTENKLSDKSSLTSNNLPLLPSIAKMLVLAVLPDPSISITSAPPDTWSLDDGVVVPIPTLPVFPTINLTALLVLSDILKKPPFAFIL